MTQRVEPDHATYRGELLPVVLLEDGVGAVGRDLGGAGLEHRLGAFDHRPAAVHQVVNDDHVLVLKKKKKRRRRG